MKQAPVTDVELLPELGDPLRVLNRHTISRSPAETSRGDRIGENSGAPPLGVEQRPRRGTRVESLSTVP